MNSKKQIQSARPPLGKPWVVALIAALLVLCPTPGARSQEPGATLPTGVERVAMVEGITEYRLANGLRVLLFPDPSRQTITEIPSERESEGSPSLQGRGGIRPPRA